MGVPVIIRDGNDKIYRTEQVGSTKAENDQADENDKRIEERMREIEEELRHITPTIDTNKPSLLELVGQKRGVVELWYRVGERLLPLYNEIEVPNENKKWLYRAFFEHSGELDPSRNGPSVRNLDRPEQSHFCFPLRLILRESTRRPWYFRNSVTLILTPYFTKPWLMSWMPIRWNSSRNCRTGLVAPRNGRKSAFRLVRIR